MDQFRNPKSAAIKGFQDGPVAFPLGLAKVNGSYHAVDLFRGKSIGQFSSRLGGFYQLQRVLLAVIFKHQVIEKTPQSGNDPGLRTRIQFLRGLINEVLDFLFGNIDGRNLNLPLFQMVHQALNIKAVIGDGIVGQSSFNSKIMLVILEGVFPRHAVNIAGSAEKPLVIL